MISHKSLVYKYTRIILCLWLIKIEPRNKPFYYIQAGRGKTTILIYILQRGGGGMWTCTIPSGSGWCSYPDDLGNTKQRFCSCLLTSHRNLVRSRSRDSVNTSHCPITQPMGKMISRHINFNGNL